MNVRVRITGVVQGVWFRESAKHEAQLLGVQGWIRNSPDGSVEGVFQGPDGAVEALINWCHHGPSEAVVDRVETFPGGDPCQGFQVLV